MKKKKVAKIFTPREAYKPFEYNQAYEYYKLQQNAHWLPEEVSMAKDLNDWQNELTDSEKQVVGQILKSFAQTETHVNEYWSTKVANWFPKHEIKDMAVTFASFESIHAEAYQLLNDTLGLDDFDAFLEDPTAIAKLERLKLAPGKTPREIAKSLAIFSAFTEGVNLFSSFAVLFNFSRFGLLDGIETLVSWSIRDEDLHSKAGCWLFNQVIAEHPEIWDDELKSQIYDAARLTVQLEDEFIDNAFALGSIRGLKAEDLKAFIRHRCNQKLKEVGLKTNWKNIDIKSLDRMEWFEGATSGLSNTDFFAKTVTDYEKCNYNIENMFEDSKNKTNFSDYKKQSSRSPIKKELINYDKILKDLKKAEDAPEWLEISSLKILLKYMLKDETPKKMYQRLADSASKYLFKIFHANKKTIDGKSQKQMSNAFFDAMWKGHLCPASPVLTNLGTDRGLPISCYGLDVGDDLTDISERVSELTAMTAGSGGVGMGIDRIRSSGQLIRGGERGVTEGAIPFIKIFDSTILGVAQGVRKGAASINFSVYNEDFGSLMRIRRAHGDKNRQCLNIHQAVQLDNKFLDAVRDGDYEAREKWVEIMKTRKETGEPYLMNTDIVNDLSPEAYKKNNLDVTMTNICSEIVLHTDEEHSFICCLSSLNLFKWDEWKDTDLPKIASLFLNGVLEEFIQKAKGKKWLEKSVRSAIKGRAIGIGALGWHSLLQSKMMKFSGFQTMTLNNDIWKEIRKGAEEGSKLLVKEGAIQGKWTKGTDKFNSHLIAGAPTRTNSTIAGDLSAWCEPYTGNAFNDKSSKNIESKRNKFLIPVLETHKKNTEDVWKSIVRNEGSVQHLDFLTDHEKAVFLTAYELDQNVIIDQVLQRQQYVDQAQSTNLFFTPNMTAQEYSDLHLRAMRDIKTLYYSKSTTTLKVGTLKQDDEEGCSSCEG